MRCKNTETEWDTRQTHWHSQLTVRLSVSVSKLNKQKINWFSLASNASTRWDAMWNGWLTVCWKLLRAVPTPKREKEEKNKQKKIPIAKNIILWAVESSEEGKKWKKKYNISVAHSERMLELKLNSKSLQSSFPKTTPSRATARSVRLRKINK